MPVKQWSAAAYRPRPEQLGDDARGRPLAPRRPRWSTRAPQCSKQSSSALRDLASRTAGKPVGLHSAHASVSSRLDRRKALVLEFANLRAWRPRSVRAPRTTRSSSAQPRSRTTGTSPLQSWAVRRGRERMRSSAKARLPRCGNQASRPGAMTRERRPASTERIANRIPATTSTWRPVTEMPEIGAEKNARGLRAIALLPLEHEPRVENR
jgi:hypothetical protein